MMKYNRWLLPILADALKYRRVLLVTGPRQAGKTTLVEDFIGNHGAYFSLDDLSYRQSALIDPHEFIKSDVIPMVIDEVQRAPDLLPAIKRAVDKNNQPGQFLITGSANVQALPTMQESLAGRVTRLQLMTLAQGEIQGKKPTFVRSAFQGDFSRDSKYYTKQDITDMALCGGFPEVLSLPAKQRTSWHKDYIDALLHRDLAEISKIHRMEAMESLIEILAAWSGKFMDLSKICAHLSVQRATVNSYIRALEFLYIVERIPPWTKTDYDRVGKQDRLFITDSGLLSSILGWKQLDPREDGERIGKLLETFIYHELSSIIRGNDEGYSLYHYRDREKREIDFLIEDQDKKLLGIEVKASSSVTSSDFKHIRWFQDKMAQNKSFKGIVLYTGNDLIPFGKNLWAVPMSSLWG